jgi:hypothetical protein
MQPTVLNQLGGTLSPHQVLSQYYLSTIARWHCPQVLPKTHKQQKMNQMCNVDYSVLKYKIQQYRGDSASLIDIKNSGYRKMKNWIMKGISIKND